MGPGFAQSGGKPPRNGANPSVTTKKREDSPIGAGVWSTAALRRQLLNLPLRLAPGVRRKAERAVQIDLHMAPHKFHLVHIERSFQPEELCPPYILRSVYRK